VRDGRLDEAALDAVFRFAPFGIAIVDADKRYVRVNERFAVLNGAPAEAHIGRTPREVIPDIAQAVESVLDHVLQTKLPMVDLEVDPPTPEGLSKKVWTRVSLHPLIDGGDAIGVLAIAQSGTREDA
jgi:PAS domain S-box-containing protein